MCECYYEPALRNRKGTRKALLAVPPAGPGPLGGRHSLGPRILEENVRHVQSGRLSGAETLSK